MGERSTILATAVVVVAADQFTKTLCLAYLAINSRLPIVDGYLALTHVHNRGMAFGLLNGIAHPMLRWVLVAVAVLAVGIIWSYARQGLHQTRVLLAFGAILGGAVGNLIDRIRWGYVVDFILAHWGSHQWPAFNVADAAITMGGIALFLALTREERSRVRESLAASESSTTPVDKSDGSRLPQGMVSDDQ